MPNLIDVTYFQERLDIPQINQVAVEERVNAYITRFEPEFMTQLLGYEFYQLFLTDIATQRMIDLKDGKTYTYNNVQYRFNGLLYVIGSGDTAVKQSCIANYVYWNLVNDSATILTGTGAAVTQSENVDRVSPTWKLAQVWNEMIDMIISLRDFLIRNKDTYPEYSSSQVNWFHWQNGLNI